MEKFGRQKYGRQLLRNQPHDDRLDTDDPEEPEDDPSPSAGAGAAVSSRFCCWKHNMTSESATLQTCALLGVCAEG